MDTRISNSFGVFCEETTVQSAEPTAFGVQNVSALHGHECAQSGHACEDVSVGWR